MSSDHRLIIEHMSDGLAFIDKQARITYINPQAERLFRRKGDKMQGATLWEIFPDAKTPGADEAMQKSLSQTYAVSFEVFFPTLYEWLAIQAIPASDGAYLFLQDVTDRVRMMQTDAVQQGVRAVVDAVPVAISVLRGPEHRFELLNTKARELISGRKVEGQALRSAFPELGNQGFFEILDDVYRTGKPFEGKEYPASFNRDPEGPAVEGFFDISYQPLRDTSGSISGILSVSVDVTHQVVARQTLERLGREREIVLQQLSEGVIVTDPAGKITFFNDVASDLHGRSRLDVEPEDYTETFQLLTMEGEPFPVEDLPLARAVQDNQSVRNARWKIRRPDGSVTTVEGSASSVTLNDGTKVGAVLTMHEVSD